MSVGRVGSSASVVAVKPQSPPPAAQEAAPTLPVDKVTISHAARAAGGDADHDGDSK